MIMDATAIAAAIADRRTTAVEVLEAAQRADRYNAFITADWDRAMDRAVAVDNGEITGPLAGVPISVKDVIAVAGLPATAASAALASNIAAYTAPAVQRLLDSGAVLVGKTNCPEFAFGTACESPVGGRTRNPRHPSVSPGGSSGGDSASVAAGSSALGVGTDFGGSLRWPAQCTGVLALRPSLRAVPDEGQIPGGGGDLGATGAAATGMQGMFQTIGPLARSVRDLRLAFDLMKGRPSPPPDQDDVRIVWDDGLAFGRVRAEVSSLVRRVGTQLGADRYERVFAECLPAYNALRALEPMRDHAAAVAGREHLVTETNRATISRTLTSDPVEVEEAWSASLAARVRALAVFDEADAVILPVAGGPACDHNGRVDIDGTIVIGWDLMGHCRAVTLVGGAVVSVPVGVSTEGLPLSVQVVTAPGREDLALTIADLLQIDQHSALTNER